MQIKFFKKEKNFKKKSSIFYNPDLYWNFAILVTILAVISATFFGYNLFMKINKDSDVTTGTGNGHIGIVKKERIQSVLDYFTEKEKTSTKIINSPAPVVDPSL